MKWIDCHVHTDISPDSQADINDVLLCAQEAGLSGVILTNHFECYAGSRQHMSFSYIERTCRQAEGVKAAFPDLYIGKGVEVGQALLRPDAEKELLKYPLDCVIASLHKMGDLDISKVPAAVRERPDYLRHYFEKLYETAAYTQFDILAHLDLPARHMHNIRLMEHPQLAEGIRQILTVLIDRDKTLEVNTSSTVAGPSHTMPSVEILRQYYALGGRNISLGSDAHTAQAVAKNFPSVAAMLKSLGFVAISWYEHRSRRSADIRNI